MADKTKVLFLCTGNSCRSQMAEGLARHLRGEVLEAYSAGTKPQQLNPYAVQVMGELGIDISSGVSKHVDDLGDVSFDYVVTVCEDAHEHCPYWPGRGAVVHQGFEDPPRLAAGLTDEADILPIYRRVRDEIREFVLTLPGSLGTRR